MGAPAKKFKTYTNWLQSKSVNYYIDRDYQGLLENTPHILETEKLDLSVYDYLKDVTRK